MQINVYSKCSCCNRGIVLFEGMFPEMFGEYMQEEKYNSTEGDVSLIEASICDACDHMYNNE